MISIEFSEDGTVRVYALKDGDMVSASADANKIPKLLPAATLETLRGCMAEFLDMTAQVVDLKRIG